MADDGYWHERFSREGKIWGEAPSATVKLAIERFRQAQVRDVLVPGCAYGRNARELAQSGFRVTGLDWCETAIRWARATDPESEWISGSALEFDFAGRQFEGIFCFNLLHLFFDPQRRSLIRRCAEWLVPGAGLFFVVFSDTDLGYGRGTEVEPNTFASLPGRPAHYFTSRDLRDHFQNFEILDTGLVREKEDHPPHGPHDHALRYMYGRKPSQGRTIGEAFEGGRAEMIIPG